MIILGLDPGTAITGFGIIEVINNLQKKHIAHGQIKTDKSLSDSERLEQIEKDLIELLNIYKPDIVSVEKLFFYNNVTTAMSVSQSRGVLLLTLQKHKIPILEYTPLQLKQGLTGDGRADKKQVQQMVKLELKLDHIPKPDDAADALGLAIISIPESQRSLEL